ncbi:sugar ABC transporter substrate-binding protein [Herbiconiux moechotypicola]|uniref:Periplasmic binding protein domain-containing protein n=1 Tax=Herbiconiux moechotypicola TaxID=637393 RepID=A0ABN3DPL9_9MICO|nr:sugar ABC transporter substrate-binding protein [Herbiconiux moechotypicola]MCS5731671.1 sugar ABC transporter substrate-binding protein [Herbiconiux moechotypicola]
MHKSLVQGVGTAVIAVMLLAGCSAGGTDAGQSDSPTDSSNLSMAFSGSELANPWVSTVKDGFEAACKDNNIRCTTLNAGSDVDKQVTDVQNAINGGQNAIIMNPVDGTALESVLTAGKEKGVASITVAQTADASTGSIYLDDAAYGEMIAENAVQWIKEELGGKGTVAILGEENIESSIARGDGIEETIKRELPDVKIVARQHANTPDLGLSVTQNLLLQYPDLNVIVAANDSGGIGAYQAFENSGLATDPQRGIFSGDKTDEAIKYMSIPDSIYRGTVDLQPYNAGYAAVEMALQQLKDGLPAEQERQQLEMTPFTQEEALATK